MQGSNNLHEYTGLRFGDADPYKSGNGRTGGDTPGPLLDSGQYNHRVLCDGFIYGQVLTHVHVIVKGLNISRTWLYWHAGTFDVSACTGFFNIILALLTTYLTFAAWSSPPWTEDSTAESANYMSTRDNHVVGVMSRCESNESRIKTLRVLSALPCFGQILRA